MISSTVSTLAVEWIEIDAKIALSISISVSTLAVEWIEIEKAAKQFARRGASPPSRWSGLKSLLCARFVLQLGVSTLAVEWIEIPLNPPLSG